MQNLLFFGPLVLGTGVGSAICLCPVAFGIRSRPDYGVALFGGVVFVIILFVWLALEWSARELDDAVNLTAFINSMPGVTSFSSEPDTRFEQNSGLKRWKKNA